MTTNSYEVTFKIELNGAMDPAEVADYIGNKLRSTFYYSPGVIKWSDLVVHDLHRGRILSDGKINTTN